MPSNDVSNAPGGSGDEAAMMADERCGNPAVVMPPRGDATGLRVQDENDFALTRQDGWIGLVAASHGYLVPGLLTWTGAANCDVEPADHVAILKYWNEWYGAELVGLGWDVLELLVEHPPTDLHTAMRVAEEQWYYCPDVVDQDMGTLDALAAVQVTGRRWYFWWD